MKRFRNITIVGSGNLAEALAAAIAHTDGLRLTIASRNARRGSAIARATSAACVPPDAPLTDTDLCIIAVSDTAIADVAAALRLPESATVVHTSGATPLDVLPERFAGRGSFYPFQTFTAGRAVDFTEIPIFIEAGDESTASALEEFAGLLSRRVARADSQMRRRIHLAGVFACNFANCMFGIGSDIVHEAGFGFDILRPLIAETTAKAIAAREPREVQTGPAVRGDEASQRRHLELLADEVQLTEIYKLISNCIWETSKRTSR